MSRISIRAADIGDSRAIAELAVLVWNDAYRAFLSPEALATITPDRRGPLIMASILAGEIWRIALDSNHAIIGFVHAKPDQRWADWHLGAIYIHPRWQRKGVGTKLMLAVVDELGRRSGRSLSLRVFAANHAAKQFYTKHGARLVAAELSAIGDERHSTEILLFDSLAKLKKSLAASE